jgi:DNA-binding transcriptional MerR regulator
VEKLYSVTELAKELGVTARAIRFYEAKGLITPQRAGQARVYTYRDRGRMVLILRGKKLGFSLREIKDYLDLYVVDTTLAEQIQMLLKGVRSRIARLEDQRQAVEDSLGELRDIERLALEALAQRDKKDRDKEARTKPQVTERKAGADLLSVERP